MCCYWLAVQLLHRGFPPVSYLGACRLCMAPFCRAARPSPSLASGGSGGATVAWSVVGWLRWRHYRPVCCRMARWRHRRLVWRWVAQVAPPSACLAFRPAAAAAPPTSRCRCPSDGPVEPALTDGRTVRGSAAQTAVPPSSSRILPQPSPSPLACVLLDLSPHQPAMQDPIQL